jgi:biotin transport system substrate-specific component
MYFSSLDNIIITLHSHLYSPQIPVAIFVGALLGPRLGAMAITGYVGLGLLGLPIFSAGGGLSYVFEPTFGFILAFIAGAFVVGTILSKKINSFNIIFAVLTGVFTIHVLGLAYLIPNLYLAGKSMAFIKAWAVGLSFINLPYDVLLGIVFCALARPIRGLLWLALD